MRWRSVLSLVSINLLVFAALLVLLEGGARLLESDGARPLFAEPDLRTRGRPFVEPHPSRGFALRPGYADDTYAIDDDGFRVAIPPPEDRPILLTLGESTTFGWGVANADTYPAELQRLLHESGRHLRVVNGGVPSYSSTQVLRYLEEVLDSAPPAAVLISILWNDIWYSTVLNWYPEILVYQKPPLWQVALIQHSALMRMLLLQPMPGQEDRVDRFNEPALEQYRANVRAMFELAARNGVPLAWVEPPFSPARIPEEGLNEFHVRYTADFLVETANRYRATVAELAEEYEVPVIDHRFSLASGGGAPHYFLDLLHPDNTGNALMGQDIFLALQSIGFFEDSAVAGTAVGP